MTTPQAGILLYEPNSMVLARRSNLQPTPTAATDSASPHVDSPVLRTNFTTPAPYDEYKESPSPVLGDSTAVLGEFGPQTPKVQTLSVFAGATIGTGLGILFYQLQIGTEWLKVVSLPGDLYIRALRCLIVPMVFCVLTIVVAETVALGRTSIFRLRTLLPYLVSSITAALQGTALAMVFQSFFVAATKGPTHGAPVTTSYNLTMQCADGLFLAAVNGSLGCFANSSSVSEAVFGAKSMVAAAAVGSNLGQLSLMDQVTAIANLVVTANIFGSLVDGSLLSIVFFSFPLGYVVAHSTDGSDDSNLILSLLRQLRNVFLRLLYGLLKVTPIAVGFLIAAAVAKFDFQGGNQVGYLFVAYLIGVVTHTLIVLPLIVSIWTKSNPFTFLRHLVPAYVFAFGCASSMATLPVAVACIQRAKVSRALSLVAMPFGTPANLNGPALYYPIAVVFMATIDGHGDKLTPLRWIFIFIVGWLGSMGTAPVPNGGMVYLMTLWTTCFPSVTLPPSFAVVLAADFIRDRISTVVNVNGNAMVTRILADEIDATFEVQFL
ncbi:hypothetical protein AC1031_017305 [Aphanomyces cochlioides]|nr:hypothetical protein AC1031_017305 [Aphanomyces cochlioides]